MEVREYNNLFNDEKPNTDNLEDSINPDSLVIKNGYTELDCLVQFIRKGYILDSKSNSSKLIFNKSVSLKETWNKTEK